jgi:hypothetical protein
MKKATLLLAVMLLSSPAVMFSQSGDVPPKQAIDITAAEIQTVLKNVPADRGADQQLKIVDMGKYNLAVGVVHRGPSKEKPGEPVSGPSHLYTAETYIILSGSGTLVTGGTQIDPKPLPADSTAYKILNGPTMSGPVKDAYSRKVGPGDVIIIPPNVFHGWTGITDHVDYLSVRPDPNHVLPAGYINPALQK